MTPATPDEGQRPDPEDGAHTVPVYWTLRACELLGALIFATALPWPQPFTWFALVAGFGSWRWWYVTRPRFKALPTARRRLIYRLCVWTSMFLVSSAWYFLYGKSTDLIEYAAAIKAVARHAGPVHTLPAHSFGVAMALYARREWGVQVQRQVLVSSFRHCKWFTEAFAKYVGLHPNVMARAMQMMVERYQGRLDWDSMSVVEMLRRTRQPTLIIHDREDLEIPFEHSMALLQAAPHAQFHATSWLGHHRLLGNTRLSRRWFGLWAARCH